MSSDVFLMLNTRYSSSKVLFPLFILELFSVAHVSKMTVRVFGALYIRENNWKSSEFMFIMLLTVSCDKTNLTFVVISYNILLNSFKMLLSSPEARLITFLKTRLIKCYMKWQLMSDPLFITWRRLYTSWYTHVIFPYITLV